jgi:hypothetical protein
MTPQICWVCADVIAPALTACGLDVKRVDKHSTRRLEPGGEARLLEHARSSRALITAAIETNCRRGELLGLRCKT